MSMPPGSRDLTRIALGVLVIGGLLAGVFAVLKPFLPALLWATMIVVATWPLMRALERRLGGRRILASALMVLAMLVVVIAPLATAVTTLIEQAARLPEIKVAELHVPSPPAWVAGLPLAGERLAAEWQAVAAAKPDELASKAAPYIAPVARWIAAQAGTIGAFTIHLGLTLLLSGVLYATGDQAASGLRRFARRLHGTQGDNAVVLAAASVRAVALGIVVTAVVQTALGALGLLVAGVPFVSLLAALMFIFCIAQLGPAIPLLGGVAWLWFTGAPTAAILLFVWMTGVVMLDNVLRPLLIKRGADLPLLLIMAGVIGGLLSFGLVGLFVGPVLLAVAYRLIGAWVAEQDSDASAATDADPHNREASA
ncbi:MAG: AI-2E family transporter YdiK [Betaproteobacteria bacterium]|jgi:predicted PurR-regulated permease PerM|nr:AI-2E family transporter YdiK [Betaproteobacteria bacterium]